MNLYEVIEERNYFISSSLPQINTSNTTELWWPDLTWMWQIEISCYYSDWLLPIQKTWTLRQSLFN